MIAMYKSLAIFFAAYLPMISGGLPLYKHYCMGSLADVQWLVEAESCHELELDENEHACCSLESACHAPSEEKEENNCCENEVEIVKPSFSLIIHKLEKVDKEFSFLPVNLPLTITKMVPSVLVWNHKKYDHFHPYPNGQTRLLMFQLFLC